MILLLPISLITVSQNVNTNSIITNLPNQLVFPAFPHFATFYLFWYTLFQIMGLWSSLPTNCPWISPIAAFFTLSSLTQVANQCSIFLGICSGIWRDKVMEDGTSLVPYWIIGFWVREGRKEKLTNWYWFYVEMMSCIIVRQKTKLIVLFILVVEF